MATPHSPARGDGARPPITFGTSGWRGVAGADFDLARVGVAVRAVARWLEEVSPGGEVVVAHDTRPDGERFAELARNTLSASGAAVVSPPGAVPTPVVTRALLDRGAAAAVVFTASHNPPEYRGMKVFGSTGGSLDRAATRRIEALAAEIDLEADDPPAPNRAAHSAVDLVAPYLRDLLAELDVHALRRAPLRVFYDAMHGAGSGVLDRALAECGVSVETWHRDPDPGFGGAAPDPSPQRLGGLMRAVQEFDGPALGLATDGDADRFAVATAGGRLLSATDALALLVDHLARQGRLTRGVAISRATGSLVERVAVSHGLQVVRCPIGFGPLTQALCSGSVDAAGEESGGFALARFGRDKDGILAGCLFAEMAASLSTSLDERLSELEAKHGRSCCGRSASTRNEPAVAALRRWLAAPPERVDGATVRAATCDDGLHLALDDGFLMLRASGTEPLLRIYAEAGTPEALQRRLAAGRELLTV